MSYKRSNSRKEFEKKVDELFALAKVISFKNAKLSYEHKNLIYQSAFVLLCSSVEEYLRVFVEDLFYNYKLKCTTLSRIPINSRTYSLFHKQRIIYESFIHNRDEAKVLEKLNVSNSYLYSLTDSNIVLTDHIDSRILVNDKKSLAKKPKNIV
jgi:hypothetical protein